MSHNSDPQSHAIDEVLEVFDRLSTTEADALATAQFGGSVALTGFQPETVAEQGESSGVEAIAEAATSFNSAL